MKITRDQVKTVAGAVVGTSVTSVMKSIIKSHYTPNNKLQSVELFVTCMTVGSMVSSAATKHTNDKIDSLADKIAEAKKEAEASETQE
jgi:hypothetical protein